MADDVRTDTCIRKVLALIKRYQNVPILLWGSIPCTGGSLWQRVNAAKNLPHFDERLKDLRRDFEIMFDHFAALARAVHKAGGRYAIEWP